MSEASGPVTVTLEVGNRQPFDGTNLAFIDGQASPRSSVKSCLGLPQKRTAETVRTRGTPSDGVMATLTIEEGFDGAFMNV